ncbi:MAG: ATP-dependent acyl-CoA ligase [Gammaproteobacteria bacterium]|nr:ATP-dependent acyl-CoA ligase [Gammaproteobacteria bacterium]
MPARTAKQLPSLHVFSGCDVPWLLEQQARARPSKTFLVWEPFEGERRTWTFSQFCEETRAYAAGLAGRGVTEGDFVALHMDNCPEFLFAWFACARLGAVAVTTNTGSSAEELEFFVSDSGSTFALTQPKYLETIRGFAHRLRWIACSATNAGSTAEHPRPSDVVPFEELSADPGKAPPRKAVPTQLSHVQYTSGTTSRPKGVAWTHANALWAAKVTTSHAQLVDSDAVPVFFPLFHANALAYTVLPTLWSGGTAVLMPKFSASRFWDIVVRNRCTWANMVLFTIRALEAFPDPPEHQFRFWALLAQLPIVRHRWGIPFISWYGMTETVTQNIHSFLDFETPPGVIGHPAHEYEVAVRRTDKSDAQPGETGRLWIRGVPGLSLFLEYLNNPEATNDAFDADGWFDTGDEVSLDENGHIRFVSRAKDMLRVGEENVAALEIETVINRVEGVIECAVVGRPDDMLEEVPVAFVVARQPCAELEADIMARCTAALARFKRPREIVFVDELPKGLLDKTLKRHLRSRFQS